MQVPQNIIDQINRYEDIIKYAETEKEKLDVSLILITLLENEASKCYKLL